MKKALFLIIDKMGDVSYAISFAKEQDDPDLWNDLLDYSMDKPRFIRGLLEEVGTAIDPITLVRRIPEGLEIEGLRDGIRRMVREYEIQFSISDGVAKVLRSEVASAMETLRSGRKRGVKFEVVDKEPEHVDVFVEPLPEAQETADPSVADKNVDPPSGIKPGHCVGCNKAFTEDGTYHKRTFSCILLVTDSDLQRRKLSSALLAATCTTCLAFSNLPAPAPAPPPLRCCRPSSRKIQTRRATTWAPRLPTRILFGMPSVAVALCVRKSQSSRWI